MRNFLSCDLAVCQQQVDAQAVWQPVFLGSRQVLSDPQDRLEFSWIEIRERNHMPGRTDKNVPGIYWMQVHECNASLISVDFARLRRPANDLTENTWTT